MKPILNNPEPFPTSDVLQSVMGQNFENYTKLLAFFEQQNLVTDWHYYNDGKSWLCKVQYKKKTVCWLSIWEHCFKLSFYFMERHRFDIESSDVALEIITDFKQHKPVGKLLPLIISVETASAPSLQHDIETIVRYKMKCK